MHANLSTTSKDEALAYIASHIDDTYATAYIKKNYVNNGQLRLYEVHISAPSPKELEAADRREMELADNCGIIS